MSRVAKETDPERLEELKKLITTAEYIDEAVEIISWELSGEILGIRDENERQR